MDARRLSADDVNLLINSNRLAVLVAVCWISFGTLCLGMGPPSKRPSFAALDTNGDDRLEWNEIAELAGDRDRLRRDFTLLDTNEDKALDVGEYRAMRPLASVSGGQLHDPFDQILQDAVAAMDESYGGWQFRPEETVDSTTFTINYTASISPDGQRRLDRVILQHVDPNHDREVSREEAIRFLELQLGIRWTNEQSLRIADGRVVDFAEFLLADGDQDDAITRSEFLDNAWNTSTSEADFDQMDADHDNRVTLAEFCAPDGAGLRDPIERFRKADQNLDAQLDAEELRQTAEPHCRYLVDCNATAFDLDGNGKLSLEEFRVSMLANFNCPWENVPIDENRDGFLAFNEFQFEARNLFQLQRRYYFHRLDIDGDRRLSSGEFPFRSHKLASLYRVSVDGEQSFELYQHEDFPQCGSPDVSPDSRWILFDATPPEGANRAQILMISNDGNDVRDVCDGLMPSWAPRGGRFACSRYEGGTGVWIMNTDGTPHRRIDDGWAAQWSPDGRWISYTNDNSIRLYNVKTGEKKTLLRKDNHPYHYIYWNMDWSPDSRQIVFKGKLASKHEIAIISLDEPDSLQRVYETRRAMGEDFAWAPDGRRILFNMFSREHQRTLIYQIEPRVGSQPTLVQEANTSKAWKTVCFSPDGSFLVLSTPN